MSFPNLFPVEGKYTGQGRFVQRIEDKVTIFDNYWLYNYNIDGNQLKPEHRQVLLDHVIPTLRKVPSHVKIFGFASKSGIGERNQALSASRALHVKKYLLSFGLSEAEVPGQEMRAFGSTFGNPGVPEDEFYRAVHVVVMAGRKSRPLPPDVVFEDDVITPDEQVSLPEDSIQAKPPGSHKWSIKYLDGRTVGAGFSVGAAGAGAQVTHHRFVLYNHETNEYHVATFDGYGGNVGLGTPWLASGSVTLPGDQWQPFTTSRRLEYSDFKGEAVWSDGPPGTSPYVTFLKANVRLYVPAGFTIGIPSAASNTGTVKVTRGGDGTALHDRP
jgi:hypothetical protein